MDPVGELTCPHERGRDDPGRQEARAAHHRHVWRLVGHSLEAGGGCCPLGTASNRSPQLLADGVSMHVAHSFLSSQEKEAKG